MYFSNCQALLVVVVIIFTLSESGLSSFVYEASCILNFQYINAWVYSCKGLSREVTSKIIISTRSLLKF